MFDAVTQEVADRFGLGDKAATLVHRLVRLMTSKRTGGLQGFLNAFEKAGMGSAVRSWVGTGESAAIGSAQVEAALGEGLSSDLAGELDVDRGVVGTALAFLVPRLVDILTPEAKVPSDSSILQRLGGFLDGAGAAVAGAGAATGDAVRDAMQGAGDAAGAAADWTGDVLKDGAAGARRMAGGVVDGVERGARKGGAVVKWLLPLLIVALLLWWLARGCQAPIADSGITGAGSDGGEVVETATDDGGAGAEDDGAGVKAGNEGGIGALAGRVREAGGSVSGAAGEAVDAAAAGAADAGEAAVDAVQAAGGAIADRTRAAADAAGEGVSAVREGAREVLSEGAPGVPDVAGAATTNGADAAAAVDVASEREVPTTGSMGGATASVESAEDRKRQAEFNAPLAVEQAMRFSQTALEALGDDFSAQQLVEALNLSIVNFASGSSAIPAASHDLLRQAADAMQELDAGTRIEIGGHTDSTGSAAVNEALSADRAQAVKTTLVGYGAPAEMLSARGYGSSQPLAGNDTAEGRFRNRRIGYSVLD